MPSKLPVPHLSLPDFLQPADHTALLDWTLAHESGFQASGVGALGEIDLRVRKSQTMQDLGPSAAVFEAAVRSQYKDWVRALRASDFLLSEVELQLAAHNDGAHFARHVDTQVHAASGTSVRALSAVYYFYREPRAFSGGELRMFPFAPRDTDTHFEPVEPKQNTMIVFPAWATHEVATVQCPSRQFADSRFAVNCWMHMAR